MEEKEIIKKVFIANDGKEFLDRDECQKYEEEFLNKVKYFSVSYNFDMNEGRGFQSVAHIAVIPSRYDDAEVIAERYAIDELCGGVFAGRGAQGFGLMKYYSIRETNKDTYFANEGVKWGCNTYDGDMFLISEEPIEGFPTPYNYRKKWGIK